MNKKSWQRDSHCFPESNRIRKDQKVGLDWVPLRMHVAKWDIAILPVDSTLPALKSDRVSHYDSTGFYRDKEYIHSYLLS